MTFKYCKQWSGVTPSGVLCGTGICALAKGCSVVSVPVEIYVCHVCDRFPTPHTHLNTPAGSCGAVVYKVSFTLLTLEIHMTSCDEHCSSQNTCSLLL